MKILQNHFTTPEQSKRLLALGVPANSADMYYRLANHQYYVRDKFSIKQHDFFEFYKNIFYPCWSVGRLIEIITICREEIYTRLLFSRVDDHTNIENLIHYISAEIENGHIDFSKLED